METKDKFTSNALLDDPQQVVRRGDVLAVDLWYPGVEGRVKAIEVGLCDVRASDGLLITFDFERNGWSIKQASTFEWSPDDTVCDEDWQEVAFVPSWGREKKTPETEMAVKP